MNKFNFVVMSIFCLTFSACSTSKSAQSTSFKEIQEHATLIKKYRGDMQKLEDYQKHALWFIKNYPEHSILTETPMYPKKLFSHYDEGKKLWEANLKKQTLSKDLIKNAVLYYGTEDIPLAESLLKKTRAKFPTDAFWPQTLGHLYSLQSNRGELSSHRGFARSAIREYEKACLLLRNTNEHLDALAEVGQLALKVRNYKKAQKAADEVLDFVSKNESLASVNSSAVHKAYLVKGLLALRENNVENAKNYLLKSSLISSPSPALASFGPNMSLAKELLKKGQKDAVLEYFSNCEKFWNTDIAKKLLQQWRQDVVEGKAPNFGGNLVY